MLCLLCLLFEFNSRKELTFCESYFLFSDKLLNLTLLASDLIRAQCMRRRTGERQEGPVYISLSDSAAVKKSKGNTPAAEHVKCNT